MSDVARPRPWHLAAPLLAGAYAAAIALAPRPAVGLALAAPLVVVPLTYWAILKRDQWLILLFATALLLPPLPLGLGDSGPHPAVICVMLGLVDGALSLSRWRIKPAPLNRAFTIFFLILLASSAEAFVYSGTRVGIGSLMRVILFGVSIYVFLFAAYGPNASKDPAAQTRLLFWFATASALFACVDFYFQFPAPAGFGPQYVWLRSGVYRRAQGLFYEASTLGNFCAFFLTMIAAALLAPRGLCPVSRRVLLPGGVIFAAALVLSYSRGSLLNVLTAIAVLVFLNRSRIRLGRFILGLITASVAALLAVGTLLPSFVAAYRMRVTTSVQYAFSATEGLLSGRVASWRKILDFLAQHPWHLISGIGYKTLPYSDYLGGTVIPDNMYLSLLAETGVVGLIAFVSLNVEILRAARRATYSANPAGRFYGGWIYAFWIGELVQMFTGDLLTYWRILPIYFWVLAISIRHEHTLS